MGRRHWVPSCHQHLCSEHFAPSCFKWRWACATTCDPTLCPPSLPDADRPGELGKPCSWNRIPSPPAPGEFSLLSLALMSPTPRLVFQRQQSSQKHGETHHGSASAGDPILGPWARTALGAGASLRGPRGSSHRVPDAPVASAAPAGRAWTIGPATPEPRAGRGAGRAAAAGAEAPAGAGPARRGCGPWNSWRGSCRR